MTAEEFVNVVKVDKDDTLATYFSDNEESLVGNLIKDIIKCGVAKEKVYQLISQVLNENCYKLLLALDGEASLGNTQITYKLYDEDDNELTGSGEIESTAFELFME